MSDLSNTSLIDPAMSSPSLSRTRAPGLTIAIDTRDVAINAWRGVAALLVAYFHCRQITWVGMQQFHASGAHLGLNTILSYLTLPIAWGSAGVPIFFVISGYCIHRGTAQKLLADPAAPFNTRVFYLRRFARIYPVLLAALLLTLALDTLSLRFTPAIHKINPMDAHAFLVNLFSLQGIAGKTFGSNGALWTLSIEVQFYVVYPILLAVRRKLGIKTLLIGVAAVNVVSAVVFERHEIIIFTSYWFSWTLGAWIAEAKILAAGENRSMTHGSRSLLLIAVVLGALGCLAFKYSQYIAFQIWALAFAAYLYQVLDKPARKSVTVRGFSWLGEFSFSLYVVHFPLFVFLASVLFHSTLQVAIWPSFGFVLLAVALAFAFYWGVERPAMQWAKGFRSR